MSGPAVVQVSAKGQFNGTATATATLSGVTAGNTLLAVVSHSNQDANGIGTTVSDGTAYTKDIQKAGYGGSANNFSVEVFRLDNASAGSHSAVATASFGTAGHSFGQIVLIEVSGLKPSPLDVAISNNLNSTTPSTGSTGALAQAVELALAVMSCLGTVNTGLTKPPTGASWVEQYYDNTTANNSEEIATVVTAATTAISAAWGTMNAAAQWIAVLVTYQASAGPFPPLPGIPLIDQRNNPLLRM